MQIENLVQGARDFACSLYQSQPGALIPNPISSGLRLLWDNVCPPPYPPPLPPSRPFEGGQCVCMVYLVEVRWNDGTVFGNNCYGPILGCRVLYTRRLNGLFDAAIQVMCRGTHDNGFSPCKSQAEWTTIVFQPDVPENGQGEIITVRPKFNQPDNCGSPPLGYPPPSVSPPYTSPPTTYNYNDGTDINFTFTVKPPSPYPIGSPPPPVCIDIKGPGFEFPVCFNPDGSISIGEGGGNNGDIEDILNQLNQLKDSFDDFKQDWDFEHNPPNFDTDPDINKEDKEPDKEGEEDDIEDLLGVSITLTKPSSDAQFGTPTVYFAGWLTFKLQNGYIERTPISFEGGYFPAPLGATGYAYTLTKGAEGKVRVYTKGN